MNFSIKMKRRNITVVGIGYVGLGIGIMLSTEHNVTMLDVDQSKVDAINAGKSPIKESLIDEYLKTKDLSISATTDKEMAYNGADFIIIAVPTNYDEEIGRFDTHIVTDVVEEAIGFNGNACIVIKSTVPVGYTKSLREFVLPMGSKVLFSPEFLREGSALKDNLYPSRVIVGCDKENKKQVELAGKYLGIVRSASKGEYQELIMGTTEAEAVKLFANTYLAMRVAYFNELDTYSEVNGLNAKDIIEGMCYDPRIGNQYNNPSFGYGGYCFPKDTKQMLANFGESVPQNLIKAIVASNKTRKDYLVDSIVKKVNEEFSGKAVIGIYKLAMKSGSDNSRSSAVLDIIKGLTEKMHNMPIYIYDPVAGNIQNDRIVVRENDFKKFKEECDIILANRYSPELDDVKGKVYTRDIFNNN